MKNVQYMVTPTNHVIARTRFRLCWAPGTLGFCNNFLPNTGEDQNKFYMSAGPLALYHMLNSSLVIALHT